MNKAKTIELVYEQIEAIVIEELQREPLTIRAEEDSEFLVFEYVS